MRIVMMTALCLGMLHAQTKPEDVKSFSLSNGMEFMVLEDHSIPNANMYLFYKVGSRNEAPGITGLSHFFEHMMFNGAKKYGPKEFDRVMEAAGGANNAYTHENLTVYTDWFPSSSLETIFDLEADRIANLAIDPKMVESERGVVASERRTGLENSNFRVIYEQVKAAAYQQHPYRWTVIGYESDIMSWTVADLEAYFKTYYAPNNCLVVVSGDVTLDQVQGLAKKYFEPIPAQTPPREIRTVEPPQNGERRLVYYKDVAAPYVMVSYHAPVITHEDHYPLALLNDILTEGRTSRFYRSLVDEQALAVEVNNYHFVGFDPGLLTLVGICAKDVTPEQLEAGMHAQIEKVIKDGVDPRELQKVKNRRVVDFYRDMETINGRANNLGTTALYQGDYRKFFEAPAAYEAVTAEQVQAVAAKYLTANNRTVGILKPAEATQ